MKIRFTDQSLRSPVEQAVSEYIGRRWIIQDTRDMTEYACHPSAILSNGSFAVFARFSDAENGLEQFEIELSNEFL